jgi:hypothetical protein
MSPEAWLALMNQIWSAHNRDPHVSSYWFKVIDCFEAKTYEYELPSCKLLRFVEWYMVHSFELRQLPGGKLGMGYYPNGEREATGFHGGNGEIKAGSSISAECKEAEEAPSFGE